MQPDPAINLLADCIMACQKPADGRGRRTPIRLCAEALVGAGTRPVLAEQCARAAGAVGAHVKAIVDAAPR